jgi:N-acetylmuramate 1-kinase
MQTTDKTMAPHQEHLRGAFSEVLRGAESLRVEPLSGDASSRRYFRIKDADKTYVLQEDAPFSETQLQAHPYLSALKLYQDLGLPVPSCYGVEASRGWILLGDLGDKTLQAEATLPKYREALRLLVELVRSSENFLSQNLDASYGGPHFSWSFDAAKLTQEMQHTAQHLVKEYFSTDEKDFLLLIKPTVEYLARRPRVLCHRDYHCRNLMDFENRLWMIDFQDTRMGPLSYDVVSLLWDPYASLSTTEQDELLGFWKLSLKNAIEEDPVSKSSEKLMTILNTPKEAAESLDCEFARTKVQRLLKAAGSYASFLNLKGRKDYLPSIRPALLSAQSALANIVAQKNWAVSEDERLLTLIDNFLSKESAILKKR